MRREVKMHIKYSRTKYILQRTLQAGATILLLTSLLHPGRVLAHLPGVTERVSVDSAGNEGNQASGISAISGDGRFVAFGSAATNLIPGGNLSGNIFVHDRQTGITEIVS